MSPITWGLFLLAAVCIAFQWGLGVVVFATAATFYEMTRGTEL